MSASAVQAPPKGITWERRFSPTEDPYETIEMEQDDIVLKNAETGRTFHTDIGVLFPVFWSRNAREITSQHYIRGPLGSPQREKDVRVMIDRVVDSVTQWAMEGRPLENRPLTHGPLFDSRESATAYATDLKYLIITQHLNFNSPVWYNIGVEGVPQQPSACFILSVIDTMDSILDWNSQEGRVFKGGSGSGVNLSRIRSSYEGISKGGWASGPVSYMCGADSWAGTMKSGGRSRRAAKMVVLDVDHPDILDQATGAPGFIRAKVRAEEIRRTLLDAGFDMSVDSGHDSIHTQFQNANNSVRVSNPFMEAVLADAEWETVARTPFVLQPVPKYKARKLWREIAKAAHACADPGMQYDDTIQHWHSTPAAGRINASNPCSEYMHVDDSPCNLAATNLTLFLDEEGNWAVERFTGAVEVMAIAQTVMAAFGDYPTQEIHNVATGFRQIGQGYTNLGAMLMTNGLAYDSPEGRAWNSAVTALMQGTIFRTSAKIAESWGAYTGVDEDRPGFDSPVNRKAHMRVAEMHRQYTKAIAVTPTVKGRKLSLKFGGEAHIDIFHREVVGSGAPVKNDSKLQEVVAAAGKIWDEAIRLGNEFGYANAHMSVLAPIGTNGYMMDNDTTGIEPGLSLKVSKKKVDGSWMKIVNQAVPRTLRKLGYSVEQTDQIVAYIDEHNSVVGAPHLAEEYYPVFDTSFEEPVGGRYLSMQAHLLQMAAAQPFLSGAISKTVNMPETVTVAEVEQVHMASWRLGLKAVAIYRNNSKATQPMSADSKAVTALAGPPPTVRHKLPRKTQGGRIKLRIVDPMLGEFEMYAFYSSYDDGSFGEIFQIAGAEGTMVNGLLAFAAKQISLGVQHGTPLRDVIKMGLGMSFAPASRMIPPMDSDFTEARSVADLLVKELALVFLSVEERHALGIFTRQEREEDVELHSAPAEKKVLAPTSEPEPSPIRSANGTGRLQAPFILSQAPQCFKCSIPMEPRGTCFNCPQCGTSTGC